MSLSLARFSSRRLAAALLISLLLSLFLSGVLDKQNIGMVRRGDFPAFYAAAKIVQQGKGEQLYSRHLQQEIENQYWPALDGNYFAFAYPAFYALYLSPLAQYPPLVAKLIFLFVQSLFFCLAMCLLKRREKLFQESPIEILTLIFSFAPVFVGLVAGQGAALNLLFLLLVMSAFEKNSRWEKDALLGGLLGLWLYKPQLAGISLIFASFVCNTLAVWCGWIVGAVLVFWFGLLASGPEWPSLWINQTAYFAKLDFAANGFQMISLFATCGEAAQTFGYGREQGQLLGAFLSALILVFTLVFVMRREDPRKAAALVLGPTLLLCGGHVLFYEAGLFLPLLLRALSKRARPLLIFTILNGIAFGSCFFREIYPFQPLFFVVFVVFLLSLFVARVEDREPFCAQK